MKSSNNRVKYSSLCYMTKALIPPNLLHLHARIINHLHMKINQQGRILKDSSRASKKKDFWGKSIGR